MFIYSQTPFVTLNKTAVEVELKLSQLSIMDQLVSQETGRKYGNKIEAYE